MKYLDRKIEHLNLLGKLFTSSGGVWFDFLFKLFCSPIVTFASGKTLWLWDHSCMYRRRTKPYGWWCLLSISDLTLWVWLLGRIDFQCWVLGKEKVEKYRRERNGRPWVCFFLCLCFFIFWFLSGSRKGFFLRFFFFFLNCANVENCGSFRDFGYIYIYIYILIFI